MTATEQLKALGIVPETYTSLPGESASNPAVSVNDLDRLARAAEYDLKNQPYGWDF